LTFCLTRNRRQLELTRSVSIHNTVRHSTFLVKCALLWLISTKPARTCQFSLLCSFPWRTFAGNVCVAMLCLLHCSPRHFQLTSAFPSRSTDVILSNRFKQPKKKGACLLVLSSCHHGLRLAQFRWSCEARALPLRALLTVILSLFATDGMPGRPQLTEEQNQEIKEVCFPCCEFACCVAFESLLHCVSQAVRHGQERLDRLP
jgi:hypothetical protein